MQSLCLSSLSCLSSIGFPSVDLPVWGSLPFAVEITEPNSLKDWAGVIVAGLFLLAGLLAFLYTTKAGIIARATTKEAVRQPVFSLLLLIAISLLVINTFIPFFSLGEDVKMLKDCGLATILICGLLLGVWTSSTSIADEIEGKTAMTLLSKPINRRQFVVGKYIGILVAVMFLLLPLMVVFLGLVDYKPFYDAKESSTEVTQKVALSEVLQIVPGLVLIFFEIAVMSAISVAISTRLPMVVNMVTCLAIFVVGHLTPNLVQAQVVNFELVLFMARIIATVLPALDVYNIQASVATGTFVPPDYLAWSAGYCVAYSTMAILLAFLLFEDRDLA